MNALEMGDFLLDLVPLVDRPLTDVGAVGRWVGAQGKQLIDLA